jgi:hypothetical protein
LDQLRIANEHGRPRSGIDVLVASVKEGFNEIYDAFFPPLSNVVQSGNDKKTKLTCKVKSKVNDKLERKG